MPNPEQNKKATGNYTPPPDDPNVIKSPSTQVPDTTFQEVEGGRGMLPNVETHPLPNTNPAARLLGLQESDIAPGSTPKVPEKQIAPTETPKPVPLQINPMPEVAQGGQKSDSGAKAVSGPGTVTTEVSEGDPIAKVSSAPGFWQQALDVAKNTGKTLFELIGDFAAGYAHQQDSPTEQRLAREHQLRVQGNQIQANKDLLSIQQGFQKQQADLDREFQNKWNTITDERERAKLKQDYDLQTQQIRNQSLMIQNQYQIEQFNKQLEIAQGRAGGGFLSLMK